MTWCDSAFLQGNVKKNWLLNQLEWKVKWWNGLGVTCILDFSLKKSCLILVKQY